MQDFNMNPWDMIFTHRYEGAAACYESELRTNPDDSGLLSEYATALLCLRRFSEALNSFKKANELADPRLKDEPYLEKIGASLWLLGKRDEAIQTFKASADGVLDGSIEYGDAAGGVSQGLLLWYAGISALNDTTKDHALKYLQKLSKKPRIRNWPGTLALFVLGKKKPEDLFLEVCGTHELDKAINRAKSDLLMRRRLVKALFYCAVRKRSEGTEAECQAGMMRCASLENPILEIEWYLAQAEAKQSADDRSK